MSAADLVAVILAVVALGAVAALAVVCTRLARLAADLQATIATIQEIVPAAVDDLVDASERAGTQVDRLEGVIRTTGSIADTVDTATQVTMRALSNPVIKGAALATGTSKAARRLRGRGGERGA